MYITAAKKRENECFFDINIQWIMEIFSVKDIDVQKHVTNVSVVCLTNGKMNYVCTILGAIFSCWTIDVTD